MDASWAYDLLCCLTYVVRPISWWAHAGYKYTKITITVLRIPESTDAQPPFAEWVVQPW